MVCKHCKCGVGWWSSPDGARGYWKHHAGGGKKGCGRKLTDADVKRAR